MYQAIVFLPLLGAIIAGAITLFGAHKRFPGGEPATGTEDHTDDAGPHVASAHVHGDAGVIHASSHETEEHEHAAEGSQPAELITSGFLVVAAVLSWIAFFTFWFGGAEPQRVPVLSWFASGTLAVDWALHIDTLTVVMLVVVNTVSALVHIYSVGYMAHDPYRPRFFAYLSMFTFAMLALVTSDNLVQLFFGWGGRRPRLVPADRLLVHAPGRQRRGDQGVRGQPRRRFRLLARHLRRVLPVQVGRLRDHLRQRASRRRDHDAFPVVDFDALTVLCVLLFMGAMGKSAQFLLHTWLPDAMEGPTPVSALIHAATMVTAGVFMVARLSPLFALAPGALAFVTFIGATTAFFAATVGLVQNDIKRVVAYSTCSQLGYMFVALGVGAYPLAIFHLFTHAFFKALLFLGSGSVIHAVGGEQDMRKMGGLRTHIPITYWMMIIGTLALTGFPLTAGYFSKDAIIEAAYAGTNSAAGYAFALVVIAALLTAFYSWRLIFLTFHGTARAPREVMDHVHESPPVMLWPLYILAAGALLAGIVFTGSFIGGGNAGFWREALVAGEHAPVLAAMEHSPFWVTYLPTLMMAIGALVAVWFYLVDPSVRAISPGRTTGCTASCSTSGTSTNSTTSSSSARPNGLAASCGSRATAG